MNAFILCPTLLRLPWGRTAAGTMRGSSSLGAVLGAALVALPAVGLLTMGLLPEQEAYANADYGFSLLAALSGAGCAGYLTYRISRFGVMFHSCPALVRLAPAAAVPDGPGEGESWPLLVALLFGPIPVLLAGLGGWVETRGRSRRLAAQNLVA